MRILRDRAAAILFSLLLAVVTINITFAVPAKPGLISVTQADGSTINIRIEGDEFFRWRSTEEGYPIVRGEDGFYYYAEYSASGRATLTTQRASINGRLQTPPSGVSKYGASSIAASVNSAQRSAAAAQDSDQTMAKAFPSQGEIRSVVILVEYSDVKFSVDSPNQAFYNQLNEEGYSVSGATGSAKDYFEANSRGQFDGQFDVYGPYTLSNTRSYYGANDSSGNDLRPSEMVADAVALADADVDFSQYDYDSDGYIDNIFVYYAGHNEAEGGSEDSIWPHKWAVYSQPVHDGKKLYIYACTSELRGSSGTTIAGIGTFCHEFSHVFGLADHYDTTGTTNGYSYGLGDYDIMTSGSYNNSGNTPPMHNGLELDMIGWNSPIILESSQSITIAPIESGEVYKVLTEVDGEYFLIENRSKNTIVWDSYLPSDGLIITHVDRSISYLNQWNYNSPNGDASHECFKFVVSGNVALNGYNWSTVPYPYYGNNEWSSTSSPAALSWASNELDINITDIERLSDYNVSFKSVYSGGGYNIFLDCDTENIYVGEPFTISATVSPDDGLEIVWSSSDSSIATIDENGAAVFIAEGSVTFTASVESEEVTYSSSLTITAANLQGAKGYITNSSNEAIESATVSIYPVTRSMVTLNGVQEVAYTRSGNTIYQTSTNSIGYYAISLDEGYYEIEVEAALYNDEFRLEYIAAGANIIDFTLISYSESVDTIAISAAQELAAIEWNPQGYTSFKLVVTSASGYISSTYYLDDSHCTVESLSPSTTYQVEVSGLEGESYTLLYSSSFETLEWMTTIPLIDLAAYEYSAGQSIEFNMLNSIEGDVVTWSIDGVELSTNKAVLSSGEYMIQVMVVRGDATYRANRFINVK